MTPLLFTIRSHRDLMLLAKSVMERLHVPYSWRITLNLADQLDELPAASLPQFYGNNSAADRTIHFMSEY